MERASGVLMHVSSLPNQQGIGTFGKSAFQFVDFLNRTKQRYWQILPLTTTSYGDSPYQSFSAFAGNTHFIDFERLQEQGWLAAEDYQSVNFGDDHSKVDYGLIFYARRPILEKAVQNFLAADGQNSETFKVFYSENAFWLNDFCDYMAIKESFDLKPWYEWDEPIRLREAQALEEYREKLENERMYHAVTQFFFFQQWMDLKEYANQQNVLIIGDMPIYVSGDSVEMWCTPQYFKVDDMNLPTVVAGCPPDAFTDEGQWWGNPIYNWDYMKEDNYQWWVTRLKESLKLYDYVRIDHFRGFESFWQIPKDATSARSGEWAQGPSIELFKTLKEQLGEVNIIAEDLGFMTDEVIVMREYTGFPGMKILQFGFSGMDSVDLPHNYDRNTIAYVGTHDNQTGLGWYHSAGEGQQRQCESYLHKKENETIAQALNRGIAASPSHTAIYTMQDLLELGDEARMNRPNTLGGNWDWRMSDSAITENLENWLRDLSETYFRAHH
ncbi:4-alpha-glucanotransferase [Atopobacter phocae]|uniref:4-alpha-glucanotransferase n=1 Tax=Atopobacter phocae TaxID=136492 RepID=UPI0004B726DC|nr:4-alpha-glucanotransferase [Atopobacter phocae]